MRGNEMNIKIEKGVPMPSAGARELRAVLEKMEVGDSIVIDAELRASVFSAFMRASIKCKTRVEPDGRYRVWRVA